jgi:hypothetical protein
MKNLFAVAAVAGLFVACLDVNDPIEPGLGGSHENIEEKEAPTSPEVIDRVYGEIRQLLFGALESEGSEGVAFSNQLADQCNEYLALATDSTVPLEVPPSLVEMGGGVVAQIQAEYAENPAAAVYVVSELIRIYDENIQDIRVNLPHSCHVIMVVTGGYDYLPNTGNEFVIQLLDIALAENLINAEQHEMALMLFP